MKEMKFYLIFCMFFLNQFVLSCSNAATTNKIISERALSGCISGDCSNGYGVYVYDNGDEYKGYWKKGHRSGFGLQTYYDIESEEYTRLQRLISTPFYYLENFSDYEETPADFSKETGSTGLFEVANEFAKICNSKYQSNEMQKEYDDKKQINNYKKQQKREVMGRVNAKIIYKGNWENDQFQDIGELLFKDKSVKGQWDKGKLIKVIQNK